ncbi:MAG: FAD-dependent monooxygenase [Chlamydiales bacterium]|nr:FAD-dependent monooxygenase [Chlamydiales bacterium]
MNGQEMEILIVGAGPTGLTAALKLAQRGYKPRIIDRRTEAITSSNAIAIQPRTLELWEEMGLIDDALAEGHRLSGVMLSTSQGPLQQLSLERLPTRYPFVLALPQAKTERLLTKHLKASGIEVERGVTLEDLVQNEDDVEVVCNGKRASYSWVIGCDGGKSDVRRFAGITFQGYELPQHFIMADLKVEWERDPHYAQVILAHEGPIAFFPFDNEGYGRLVIDVTTDPRLKNEKNPTAGDFRNLMSRRSTMKTVLHDPSWISSFWIHVRLADAYHKGRLFLAGDAAHLHSPFGGQGLNTGVQDAYFLAELLCDVFEEVKEPEEIEEYERVRRSVGEQIVTQTAMMTRIVTSRSLAVQTVRNIFARLFLGIPYIRYKAAMKMSQLIYR